MLQDLRHAIRTLRKSPGFTVVAVLTLAVGISAATAGFTLLNWLLIRPVPGVRDAARLGLVWIAQPSDDGSLTVSSLDPVNAKIVAERTPALSAFVGRQVAELNVAAAGAVAVQVTGEFVMPGYFRALGMTMQQGRALPTSDHRTNTEFPTAVISDHLWRTVLGGRNDVVGHTIGVNGIDIDVVGVAAPGFRGTNRMGSTDLWLPLASDNAIEHLGRPADDRTGAYEFLVRLRPGATFALAQRQLRAAVKTVVAANPGQFDPKTVANVYPGIGLEGPWTGTTTFPLRLIIGVALLVLLVACANVANLLLLRRVQRRTDGVVRLVLGAGRARLVRYYLAESVVLGLLGAAGAAVVVPWLPKAFEGLSLIGHQMNQVATDWRVFAFAAAVGLATSGAAGLLPALLGARLDPGAELKAAGPTQAPSASRLRDVFAGAQIAVALTLVSGTYLLARTLQNYAHVPLGFDPDSVSVFYVRPSVVGYDSPHIRAYLQALEDRVRGTAGVEQVVLADLTPFQGMSRMGRVRPATAPPGRSPLSVSLNHVTGDYFATLHIKFLRGEAFESPDIVTDTTGAVGRVVLNQAAAHKLFGDEDPIGRLVAFGSAAHSGRECLVTGVVSNTHWLTLARQAGPMVYVPFGQADYGRPDLDNAMVLVRAGVPTSGLVRAVQEAARALDPSLSIVVRGPLSRSVAGSVGEQTFFFRVVGILAVVTLILTGVGVFSLVAYGVASRTKEFGIRMALGAAMADIARTVVRPSLTIAVVGIVAGTAGALYLTRFIRGMLFGVSPLDSVAFGLGAAVLLVIVLVATYIPARRATRIAPAEALRHE